MYLAAVLYAPSELPEGARVLDAGCGGGDFAIGLREAGYEVLGSDASESAIRTARERGIGRFEQASLHDNLLAPFGHRDIATIVSVEDFEHLYSPPTFVCRAHEALSDSGLLMITTPYWGWLECRAGGHRSDGPVAHSDMGGRPYQAFLASDAEPADGRKRFRNDRIQGRGRNRRTAPYSLPLERDGDDIPQISDR